MYYGIGNVLYVDEVLYVGIYWVICVVDDVVDVGYGDVLYGDGYCVGCWIGRCGSVVLIYEVYAVQPTLPFTPAKFWRIRIAPMVNSVEFEI